MMDKVEKVLINLANHFSHKTNVTLLTFRETNTLHYGLDDNVQIHSFNLKNSRHSILNFIFLLNALIKLRKYFIINKFSHIVSFMTVANIFVLIASFRLPIKVIISERSTQEYLPMEGNGIYSEKNYTNMLTLLYYKQK